MKSQLRWCLLLLISAKSNGDLITFEITEPSQFASRPSSSLNVTVVDLTIHNFIFLNLQQTNLLLDINVTLKWFDHRFGISPSTDECRSYTRSRIESNDVDSVWRPKLNFHGNQEAQIQELPYKNEFLWYDSDGIMLYQQHYKLKIPCKITLDRFPMDEAACFINFGAIEYDDTKVKLKWNSQNAPISILANRHLEEHSLHTHYVKSVKSRSHSELYTELVAALIFKRHYSWYLLQAYVPSGLIILVTWLHGTLRPQNAVPRLQIGSAMLLAVIVLFFNVLRNVPRFGRIKAMDVWLIGCICALMISAAETAVVALLMHLSGEAEEQKKFEETRVRIRNFHSSRMRHEKWADTAKILDNIFIIIFPLGFTTFIFLYWAYYLTMHFDR